MRIPETGRSELHLLRRLPLSLAAAAVIKRGGGDARVPHHIFHGRDIDILVKKPGREGTAEVMRRDVLKPRPDPPEPRAPRREG